MKFTLTPFDKALIGILLPLIGTAVEKLAAHASLSVVLIGLATSVLTGLGVYLKTNAS